MKSTAYQQIKDNIVSCDYMPGERLIEKQLIEETGVGRTPVREALLRLQQERWIDIRPRSGIYVNSLDSNEVIQLYQLRRIIEPEVAILVKNNIDTVRLLDFCDQFKQLCSKNSSASFKEINALDIEFHRYIISCTENRMLMDFFKTIMESVYRLGVYNSIKMHHNSTDDTYAEHVAISKAIIMGNDNLIRDTYTEHINHSQYASLTAFRSLETHP